MTCKRCGRELKNPRSIINGMGPVCYRKSLKADRAARGRAAHYQIVAAESTPEMLVIRDVGPWDMFFTVTNDAENVVAELVAAGELPVGRRLVYYDSEGDLDELLVVDGKFAGFKHVRAAVPS